MLRHTEIIYSRIGNDRKKKTEFLKQMGYTNMSHAFLAFEEIVHGCINYAIAQRLKQLLDLSEEVFNEVMKENDQKVEKSDNYKRSNYYFTQPHLLPPDIQNSIPMNKDLEKDIFVFLSRLAFKYECALLTGYSQTKENGQDYGKKENKARNFCVKYKLLALHYGITPIPAMYLMNGNWFKVKITL
ncbi:MAG: hypothetical protein NT007_00400 [Candidatus Kapabacteria bacterium]|nr:hypothetical protein [Candidatus Kapabacteria bacterium]